MSRSVTPSQFPKTWEATFEKCRETFDDIDDTLKDRRYFPNPEKLYTAFELCPLNEVKVVIVGQDPYHDEILNNETGIKEPQAQGLSFSVAPWMPVPPSLKNIYKELKLEYPEYVIPNHGDLTSWAKQGVLLLNNSLTVDPHKAGSHTKVWAFFIERVIQSIAEVNPKCIYVLWGKDAQKLEKYIPNAAIKLSSAHPSPLSASRGFFGNGHFKLVNQHLKSQGKEEIKW